MAKKQSALQCVFYVSLLAPTGARYIGEGLENAFIIKGKGSKKKATEIFYFLRQYNLTQFYAK